MAGASIPQRAGARGLVRRSGPSASVPDRRGLPDNAAPTRPPRLGTGEPRSEEEYLAALSTQGKTVSVREAELPTLRRALRASKKRRGLAVRHANALTRRLGLAVGDRLLPKGPLNCGVRGSAWGGAWAGEDTRGRAGGEFSGGGEITGVLGRGP